MESTRPVPDVVILVEPAPDLSERYARPEDVHILIEVSSLARVKFDCLNKLRIYGQAGILLYWILDMHARSVTQYQLGKDGNYVADERYDMLPLGSDIGIPLADMLPKRPLPYRF
jgi:Uma2 family endonuclease